ncbi:MAG TPA: nucleoside triphosphate pyrophosphohydrolase [candidate division Zixibacteria bacterium]|nr:nucleoside triphosphate pyrophosphohydrolase [candidate division Zixibacteria bacterium]
MAIVIVGLGPGDAGHLSREAWDILSSTELVFCRTTQHPSISELPDGLEIRSFDYLYDSIDDFDELYRQIASVILKNATADLDVVYAVPGHPLVGESTVEAILTEARIQGVGVRIVPGISFIEPILTALNIDALDGLQVFDALQIAGFAQPPINTDVPLLLGQVYNRLVASETKMTLMALYPDEHNVVLIHSAGTSEQSIEDLLLYEMDRSQQISHLTSLYVPAVSDPSSLQSFAETVAYLRSPDGCPWDQEQTRQSLRKDFLEEVAEVLEALDADSPDDIQEELGDVLYHVVMQAQIASELGEFNLSDVVAGINGKLIRRHPHIWGDDVATNTSDVVRKWEQIKALEKDVQSDRASLLDKVPSTLPALARAQAIQSRVQSVGFDWPSIDGVVAKVEEELSELRAEREPARVSEELGDLFFALVNWARWLDLQAESVLREANSRFEHRFKIMEQKANSMKLNLAECDVSELDDLWEEAKISFNDQSSTSLPEA